MVPATGATPSGAEAPEQIVWAGPALAMAAGLTVNVAVAVVAAQPLAAATVLVTV